MNSFFKAVLSACILLSAITSYAQSSNENALLWKITGNGLQKPSYLFGTLHLHDERIFNFDDSVYAAIANSEGFANEVDMNEMAAYYFSHWDEEIEAGERKLVDLMGRRQVQKMEKRLKKKFKKDIDDITVRDINREKEKWMDDYFKKGQMPTFIDAYLYNLARRQGKWLGGVEEVKGHMELLDGMDVNYVLIEDEAPALEGMINSYMQQDVQSINESIDKMDSLEKDVLLIKRNRVMANSMDSLSHIRSMFYAVGAAHLPSDSGIVAMLRAMGYSVTPVFCATKTPARSYTFKEVPIAWSLVKGDNGFYSLSMPGSPSSVKMYGLIDMKILLDYGNMSCFYSMEMVGAKKTTNIDSLSKLLIKSMFGKQKLKLREVTANGTSGRELMFEHENVNYRFQVFQQDNVTFLLGVFGKKKEYVQTSDADKFFSSFSVDKQAIQKETGTYQFSDPMPGISFQSPAEVTYNEKVTTQFASATGDQGWDVGAYTGQDTKTGAFIMLMVRQAQRGNYIPDDSAMLDLMGKYVAEQYGVERKDTLWQGIKAVALNGVVRDAFLKGLTFVRGNKHITLLVISEAEFEKKKELQQIFSSVELLPYMSQPWKQQKDSAGTFSVMAPGDLRKEEAEFGTDGERYHFFDSTIATTYNIVVDTLDAYTWASSDTAFLGEKMRAYLGKKDTIYTQFVSVKDGGPVMNMICGNPGSQNYERVSVYRRGKVVYTLLTNGNYDSLLNGKHAQFFSSFTPLYKSSFDISKHRGAELLNNLKSEDSATRHTAYMSLWQAPFKKEDLPMLHEAFFYGYKHLFTQRLKETVINNQLATLLKKYADSTTVQFIDEHYTQIPKEYENIKPQALEILSKIQTYQSYTTLIKLMRSGPIGDDMGYMIYRGMTDSLELLNAVYPQMRPLLTDTCFGPLVAGATMALHDSSLLTTDEVKALEAHIVKLVENMRPALLRDESFSYWKMANVLKMLELVKTPAAINAIRRFTEAKNMYIKQRAALALLKIDERVEAETWMEIAAKVDMRTGLYEALKNVKKEKLFPKEYLQQKYFAESQVYDAASDEESIPEEVKLLGERTKEVSGKNCKFYVYRVTYGTGDETSSYLGFAGGYDPKGNSIKQKINLAGVYWTEAYSEEKMEEQFEAVLTQYEGYLGGMEAD